MDLSSKTADNDLEDKKSNFLDFLIKRAKYPVQEDSEDFYTNYRTRFEDIIMKDGGIFEEVFLQIQKNIKDIAKKNKKSEKDALVIKQAREDALSDLAEKYLNHLGEYYKDNSKYYFHENELTKYLSHHFLTKLYSDHELATKMLQAQKNKTVAQHEYKVAEFSTLLPTVYNNEVDALKCVEDSFDFFLASPSVINVNEAFSTEEKSENQEKPKKLKTKKEPRADLLKRVNKEIPGKVIERLERIERIENSKQMNGDLCRELKKRREDQEKFDLEKASKSNNISSQEFIGEHLENIKKKLGADNNLDNLFKELNPVEQVFVIQEIMLYFAKKEESEGIKKAKKLEADINKKRKELKEARQEVTSTYLQKKLQAQTIRDIPKDERQAAIRAIRKQCNADKKCQNLKKEKLDLENRLKALKNDSAQNKADIKNFKDNFIKNYYPQIIPVAKEFAKSYQVLAKKQAENTDFLTKGGTYSCLSFLPVEITNEKGTRLECLVAMSGVELDKNDAVNAHAILEKFAKNIDAVSSEKGSFTYRYVGPGSHSLDLLLKQIGKGLSGSSESLSSIKPSFVQARLLPEFEKACAEKRLINELINLYSEKGNTVRVLGCDNIALPKSIDAKNEVAKTSPKAPIFMLDANLHSGQVSLKAEHITCCASCQAQKPAVMTVLFDAATKKRPESKNREEKTVMTPEVVNKKVRSINASC